MREVKENADKRAWKADQRNCRVVLTTGLCSAARGYTGASCRDVRLQSWLKQVQVLHTGTGESK